MNPETFSIIEALFPREELPEWRGIAAFPAPVFLSGVRLTALSEFIGAVGKEDRPSAWLCSSELERFRSFSLPKRRLEWLGGRLAAKRAVEEALAYSAGFMVTSWIKIEIKNYASGQPFLIYRDNSPPVQLPNISISHSGDWSVAMASMACKCGIDIQRISEQTVRVKERFCSAAEQQILAGAEIALAECEEGLTLLWAAKEAIRKVVGKNFPPGFLDIRLNKISCPYEGKWHFYFSVFHPKGILLQEEYCTGVTYLGPHALAFTMQVG